MPAAKLTRPAAKQQLVTGTLINDSPQATSRLMSDLAAAHRELASRVEPRAVVVATLTAGSTVINHGLGRKPRGASVTPTVAAADFGWALTGADDKQVTITTVGTTQTNAAIEVW